MIQEGKDCLLILCRFILLVAFTSMNSDLIFNVHKMVRHVMLASICTEINFFSCYQKLMSRMLQCTSCKKGSISQFSWPFFSPSFLLMLCSILSIPHWSLLHCWPGLWGICKYCFIISKWENWCYLFNQNIFVAYFHLWSQK